VDRPLGRAECPPYPIVVVWPASVQPVPDKILRPPHAAPAGSKLRDWLNPETRANAAAQGAGAEILMKLLPSFTTLLALTLAGCGTFSVPGTPETATSLNGFRASHGLSELRTDGTLVALASAHAADMAQRDSLDHNGFMTNRGPGGARAENVAYGCKESACVIQQWVNSSGHRKNMLIPSVTRYGLASATSPSGKKYWTLLVGE
jgi:hypothetical protein